MDRTRHEGIRVIEEVLREAVWASLDQERLKTDVDYYIAAGVALVDCMAELTILRARNYEHAKALIPEVITQMVRRFREHYVGPTSTLPTVAGVMDDGGDPA